MKSPMLGLSMIRWDLPDQLCAFASSSKAAADGRFSDMKSVFTSLIENEGMTQALVPL